MGPWGVGLQGECMNEKAKTAAAQRSNDTSHVARVRDPSIASGARYDFGYWAGWSLSMSLR